MRPQKTGMTLLEVLISVSLLSFGIVAIFQPLLTSLSALNYVDTRSEASRLAANFLWELKEQSTQSKNFLLRSGSGKLIGQTKTYNYDLSVNRFESARDLREVKLSVLWISGGQKKQVERIAYFAVPSI